MRPLHACGGCADCFGYLRCGFCNLTDNLSRMHYIVRVIRHSLYGLLRNICHRVTGVGECLRNGIDETESFIRFCAPLDRPHDYQVEGREFLVT
jgi:hypothetical protein